MIPSPTEAEKVREDIIKIQSWLSQYSVDDKDVRELVIHLSRARGCIEQLMMKE
jgi:hypothetical protein